MRSRFYYKWTKVIRRLRFTLQQGAEGKNGRDILGWRCKQATVAPRQLCSGRVNHFNPPFSGTRPKRNLPLLVLGS